VRYFYILGLVLVALLFVTGVWDYIGNGVLSETTRHLTTGQAPK
jgi:hypothetical protein